ncbi:MAG TPA: alkaline phosphatase family protein [Pyrinomonadaceae bacterium]
MFRSCANRNGRIISRSKRYLFGFRFALFAILLALTATLASAQAQAKRLVVIKCDGLPNDLLDRFVRQRDPETGKSELPWIEHIFYERGTRINNFYVRGMSLSAPSWSLLDTGQHLQIKGNVEFDRYTLHAYDYLNFIPLYVAAINGSRIDMPGVEVLDSLGIPLLTDAYPHDERYVTFSLFLRGARYSTLQGGLQGRFKKSPKDLFDEWTMGFELRHAVIDQLVREVIGKLGDPKVRYLDLFLPDFDHIAHHNNDVDSQLNVLKGMDAVIGQVWTSIQKSQYADDTVMVLVSDHGFNTDPKIYSQGFNLVKLLGSREGGGHHVITKRRLMLDYSIKGIYPLVPLITTTSNESYYLKGQSSEYPTAMLDFDGNERASIHLRDSDVNELHILLQQLQSKDLPAPLRSAATREFFAIIDRRRQTWSKTVEELNLELAALRESIEEQRKEWEAQPKKFTKEELEAGKDETAKRIYVKLERSIREEREYSHYATVLNNLLSLQAGSFEPAGLKIDDVIPRDSLGDRNTIFELQNYVVGLSTGGLQLSADGSIDRQRSFLRIDYFNLLHDVTVRNVQRELASHPIDMIATRIESNLVAAQLNESGLSDDAVWINGGDKQALLLFRENSDGDLSIRYQPIKNFTQSEDGKFHFELLDWQPGLPLHILEDPNLVVPVNDRAQWLSGWHTDVEWLNALHRTTYSNGLIGLHEELARHPIERLSTSDPTLTDEEKQLRKFQTRERELCEADMLIVANNHWNFDVRGFNPGGNHGSFFRISTHAVLMFAGGAKTGIGQGKTIDQPYDSLSFVPTLLALTGELRDDRSPTPELRERGFRRFPGRVIKELSPGRDNDRKTAITGARSAP